MGLLGSLGRGVQGLLGGVGQVAGTLMSPLYRDIEDPVARQQALLGLSAGLQGGQGIGAAGLMGRQAGMGYLKELQDKQEAEQIRQFRQMQMDAFKGKQEQEGQDRNAQAQILGQLTGRSAESFQANDPLMVQSQARRMMPGELSPGFEGSPGVGRQAALGTALANPGAVKGNELLQNLMMPQGSDAKFGNVNPGDFTPASLARFAQTRNYADLVRVQTNNGPDAPSGYRWNPDGSLGPIPGGPADEGNPNNRRKVRADATALRKDFEGQDSVKSFKAALPMLVSARRAPDTGAGDLDVIYAVGKALDPGSVVREGELELVIKSGSLMEQLLGSTRMNFGQGGRLTPERRKQLLDMLNERVMAYRQAYEGDYNRFGEYANSAGIAPREVVGRHFANTLQPSGSAASRKQAPPAAVDALKANPALADDFKKKYGYLP